MHKVSIIPRGIGSLGYTIQRPTEDRFLMTQRELESKLAVLLAGRAAEQLVFGELFDRRGRRSREGDGHRAQHGHALRHGSEARLCDVRDRAADVPRHGAAPTGETFSDETVAAIDDAVRRIVAAAFDRATALLQRHRSVLERGAARLLDRETLDQGDLEELRGALLLPAEAPAVQPAKAG